MIPVPLDESTSAWVKALLVHALSEAAFRFYEEHGFQPFPDHPRTLFLRLSDALQVL